MKALHFDIAYRTNGTKKGPAAAHVRYITRAQDGAEAHVGYVTRTTQRTREDLVASGYGNLPAWAHEDPVAFFAASDTWERINGRTATQMTAALPRALDHAALTVTVEAFVQTQLRTAHAYVWGIHETIASDGGRYPHVHIAFSERQDTGKAQTPQEYFAQHVNPKARSFNSREWPYAARQAWSDTLNVALEAAGSTERVSGRSFRDQGIDWQTAEYIDRKTLQRNKALLHQRGRTEDTPEALAKRTQEWEARKHELGITRGMNREEVSQRIGDASRAHIHAEHLQRRALSREFEGMSADELSALLKLKQERLAAITAVRRAEEHFVKNPSEIRTPSHLAAVAKVLRDNDTDEGQVQRRRRTRDDEQDRTRTYAWE